MAKIGFEYLKTVPVYQYVCLIEKLVLASCILDPQATMIYMCFPESGRHNVSMLFFPERCARVTEIQN